MNLDLDVGIIATAILRLSAVVLDNDLTMLGNKLNASFRDI